MNTVYIHLSDHCMKKEPHRFLLLMSCGERYCGRKCFHLWHGFAENFFFVSNESGFSVARSHASKKVGSFTDVVKASNDAGLFVTADAILPAV